MDTTDHIGTMATILGRHTIGPTDTAITATTVIIITIGTKLDVGYKIHWSWLGSDSEPALFLPICRPTVESALTKVVRPDQGRSPGTFVSPV